MIPRHLVKVFDDPAFIESLNSDMELQALEQLRRNPVDELAALCQVLGGGYRIEPAAPAGGFRRFFRRKKGMRLLPITPAVWSLWWCLELPFVKGEKTASELDADIALYTLSKKADQISGSAWSIALQASGTCRKHGIDYHDAVEVIGILAKDALRPLELLPPVAGDDGDPEYGADWLTRITGTVADVMNYPAHLIALERPLAEVTLHFCWKLAANDRNLDIKRHTPQEACSLIWERTLFLAEEWSRNNGS